MRGRVRSGAVCVCLLSRSKCKQERYCTHSDQLQAQAQSLIFKIHFNFFKFNFSMRIVRSHLIL